MQSPEPQPGNKSENKTDHSGQPGFWRRTWAELLDLIAGQREASYANTIPEPAGGGDLAQGRTHLARERIAHAWKLLCDYWFSRHWKSAWLLLIAYIGLQSAIVAVIVWVTVWQRHFYDAIQQMQKGLFYPLILTFIGIMMAEVALIVIQSWVSMTLAIRWRMHLTERYLGRWFARDRFYEIERLRLVDNPDQRIAEDIKTFTNVSASTSLLGFIVGFVTQLASAVSFIVLMAPETQPIRFALFGHAISIPYDLVWLAILYAIGGSILVAWIGRAYVRRNMRQQHMEGDFRSYLVHTRRNAEQISFMRSQGREKRGLADTFGRLKDNYQRLILSMMGLNFGQGVYQRIGMLIPLFVLVQRFFRGKISFGQVMSGQNAFTQLVSNLSYLVSAYNGIALMLASLNRLKALDDAMDQNRPRGITTDTTPPEAGIMVAVRNLKLQRPQGGIFVDVGDWTVRAGERWSIQGASGSGKSTLLRAIAGLWPDGSGTVYMTSGVSAMLVPQRLYLPLGTLKQAVCFPDDATAYEDAEISALLERVHLSAHVSDMLEARMWHEELSPGEQQRVALARILLHKPDLIVLDEATSSLDAVNARHFHEVILQDLPEATLISVVHDTRVLTYYTHTFRIHDGRGEAAGNAPVSDR